jgi:hypothetical protein
VNVYEVPSVRPEMVHVVVLEVQVAPPGEEVTVYKVIALPPVLAGAVHEIVTLPLALETPVTPVGAPGNPRALPVVLVEPVEYPDLFVEIVTVADAPAGDNPRTVTGIVEPEAVPGLADPNDDE